MAQSTFTGPVRSLNGFISQGPGSMINITGNVTLNPATHGGRTMRINAASPVITLPTIVAGGADPSQDNLSNLGIVYNFVVETNATGLDVATDQTDKFIGSLLVQGTTTAGFTPGATNDHIKTNGTTTGALVGSYFSIVATAALKYQVTGLLVGSGAVATPFADS